MLKRKIAVKQTVRPLKSKKGSPFTHQWKLQVVGKNDKGEDEDIGYYVKKVCYHLHETFQNPKRDIEKFPYKIEEKGYGGFIMKIEVFFLDPKTPSFSFEYDLSLENDEKTTEYEIVRINFEFNCYFCLL